MSELICIYPPPGSVDVVEVKTIYGKTWKFEFSERFGPLFIRPDDMPYVNQPKVTSAAWAAFEDWLDEQKANGRFKRQ
jgi:hypothetical protein